MLGLLGAIDPHKHKMNVGAIKIQRDTGVAVITIEEKPAENNPTPLVLSTTGPSEMLVNNSFQSNEDYYTACSIAALLRMLKEPSLAQSHDKVLCSVIFTYKTLGSKGVIYLSLVVPAILQVVKTCDQSYLGNFLTRLASFIEIVGQHIRNYVDSIVEMIKLYWLPDISAELATPLIQVVQTVALATGPEFRVHLKDVMPLILKTLACDGNEKIITRAILEAFCSFGCNLDDFLHLLLPHITGLFDAPNVAPKGLIMIQVYYKNTVQ